MQKNNENFTNIIDRLKEYTEMQCISMNQIAIKIGVSNSYFSKMAKNNGLLGEEIIRKILLYYENINPEWLLTGKGSMLKSVDSPIFSTQIKDNDAQQSTLIAHLKTENKELKVENKDLHKQIGRLEGRLESAYELIENLKKEMPAPGLFRAVK